MRIIVLALCSLSCALFCGGSWGCESKEKQREEMMIQTPLALDPTDPPELSAWWANGRELLLLDDDASYTIYQGPGRYSAELERGRWSRENYATVWLEPYRGVTSQRVRVHITRADGKLALMVPRYQTFKPVDAPPMTLEDRLIGRWQGPLGELRVGSNRRYELVPTSKPAGTDAASVVGHRGSWGVSENDLVLQPDAAGAKAISLKIVADDNHVLLNSSDGVMTKVGTAATTP
jgi:hypothetical protein